ncbi:hypothetical protein RI129_007556 [Pyrocoelia pectoralis]|uniref:Sodium channel protein Nach n=1 Tax=Pyrocoelia pectoralis TaxID=417401 RepID=A0AAN7VEN7_9COLE
MCTFKEVVSGFFFVWNAIKQNVSEFCKNTSLHAVHYFTDDNLCTTKKIFFGFSFFLTAAFTVYLSVLQLIEFQDKVIITTVSSATFPIEKVRFPAVIICNVNVVFRNAVEAMLTTLKPHNISETTLYEYTSVLSSLITSHPLNNTGVDYAYVEEILQNFYTVDKLMAMLAQPCSSMLKECYWKNKRISCTKYFQRIKTSGGFCCAFNYDGMFDISNLVDRNPVNHSYYIAGSGSDLGLRIVLDAQANKYHSVTKPVYGFNGNLYWSDRYSYKTCTSQCKAYTILKLCKCLPFYYPLIRKRKICSLMDVPCLEENMYNYSSLNHRRNLEVGEKGQVNDGNGCNCHPQCEKTVYELYPDRVKATTKKYYNTNYSILNVYYNTNSCQKTESDLYSSWQGAIALVGGIVGLCLGGSIVTVLEIIFFGCQCPVNDKEIEIQEVNHILVNVRGFNQTTNKECVIGK